MNKYGDIALTEEERKPDFRLSGNVDMNKLIVRMEALLGITLTRPATGEFEFTSQSHESLYDLFADCVKCASSSNTCRIGPLLCHVTCRRASLSGSSTQVRLELLLRQGIANMHHKTLSIGMTELPWTSWEHAYCANTVCIAL